MKNRSLVGPAILIALGLLFLAHNIFPDFRPLRLLTTYWPYLLIGWGVLRLAEILMLAASSRPLPSHGLSRHEVLLVTVICIVGLGHTAVTSAFGALGGLRGVRIGPRTVELFGESYDYPLSQEKTVGEKPRVIFDHLRGNIRVTGSDSRELQITGRKTIRAYDKGEADQNHQKTPLEVTVDGDRVTIRTNHERVAENRYLTSDLEVSVPRGSSIEGRGRRGDYEVNGIAGDVEISSDSAGVRLNKIGGNAKIDVRSSDVVRAIDIKGNVEVNGKGNGGDLELENVAGAATVIGSFGGNLEFKNIAKVFRFESRNTEMQAGRLPGHVSMNLGKLTAQNLAGPIRLRTRSKDVRLEDFTDSLDLEVERGDIELRPHSLPLARIVAVSRSTGNIDLSLPAAAKFDLSASTDRGEVQNDFGDPLKTEVEGRSATIKGKAGSGASLQLKTSRGSITVRKE